MRKMQHFHVEFQLEINALNLIMRKTNLSELTFVKITSLLSSKPSMS